MTIVIGKRNQVCCKMGLNDFLDAFRFL